MLFLPSWERERASKREKEPNTKCAGVKTFGDIFPLAFLAFSRERGTIKRYDGHFGSSRTRREWLSSLTGDDNESRPDCQNVERERDSWFVFDQSFALFRELDSRNFGALKCSALGRFSTADKLRSSDRLTNFEMKPKWIVYVTWIFNDVPDRNDAWLWSILYDCYRIIQRGLANII